MFPASSQSSLPPPPPPLPPPPPVPAALLAPFAELSSSPPKLPPFPPILPPYRSSLPPPLPPPLSPPPHVFSQFMYDALSNHTSPSKSEQNLKMLIEAQQYPSLANILKTYSVPIGISISNSYLMHLAFVPQIGPQCGFAALSMIASSVGIFVTPNCLVAKAKEQHLTNHGEMYSAENMASFANSFLSDYFDVMLVSHSLKGHYQEIKEHIQQNSLIMIPVRYDADYSCEPCLKNGHRAHWAVLYGYVDGYSENNFYVIARHGKSRLPGVWKFSDLQLSNDNLYELDPERQNDENIYILPEGGVKQGLASKCIIFQRKHCFI